MVNRSRTELRSSVLSKRTVASEPCGTSSPCPTPVFFFRDQTFSTKKERQTPRNHPPPTPRPRTSLKSCPPASRLFSNVVEEKPQSISFIESNSRLPSKYYDEKSKVLYFNQCFDVICKLGSGSFGDVFKVRCKEDGKYYAVKRSKERFRGRLDRMRKLEEVKKHEQLPLHENCVQFYKAWEEKGHLYIQTELCETSLSQYTEENHDIPESTVWSYLIDLLLAVKHLHDHDLIHLDIKPENIFISKDGTCKLGDFGLVLDVSKGTIKDALEGDPKYLAPELMNGTFTKAADIFSLGITILELACDLDLPRGDTAWHQLRQKQIPEQFLKRLSSSLTEVIQKMMEPDHKLRPTVDDILKMQAVQKVYKTRLHMMRFKTWASYVTRLLDYALMFLGWIRDCVFKPFTFCRKEEERLVTPSRFEQKLISDYDYSFSDEDVFEPDNNRTASLNDVCTVLFDDEVKFLTESDDECPLRSPCRSSRYREVCFPKVASSTPTDQWKGNLSTDDCSSVRSLRFSPCLNSSPVRSVRRSPRLASKEKDVGTPSKAHIGPRNLLAEFEREADKMAAS